MSNTGPDSDPTVSVTEKKSKSDVIISSREAYLDDSFSTANLAMPGAKNTVEADRPSWPAIARTP